MKAIIKYYDVLGNAKQGYDINDVYQYGEYDFAGNRDNDEDIIAFLNAFYFNKTISLEQMIMGMDQEYVVTIESASDGKPICEIEFID